MALETLKEVKEIRGFKVGTVGEEVEGEDAPFIMLDHDENAVMFKIQKGSVKDSGVNGCQVDSIIGAAKAMVEGLNKNFPSKFNDGAIQSLNSALVALKRRTADREARGVEGTNAE